MDDVCPDCRPLLTAYRQYVGEYAKAVESLRSNPDFERAYDHIQELRSKCREMERAFRECAHGQKRAS